MHYPYLMPPITAVLHTHNDALRLGRALETLFPCSEILVIDHGSIDDTPRIARNYGARVVVAKTHAPAHGYLDLADNDWIFCMDPAESLSEGLQASLFEWGSLPPESIADAAFSVPVRHQVGDGWLDASAPSTRLISRRSPGCTAMFRGNELLPQNSWAVALEGVLLHFDFP